MWQGHVAVAHICVDRLKHRFYICSMTDPDQTLDALGLLCPLPVLKARKRLSAMMQGQVLRMIADDPAAIVDVPHFCTQAGHTLLAQSEQDGVLTFDIRHK